MPEPSRSRTGLIPAAADPGGPGQGGGIVRSLAVAPIAAALLLGGCSGSGSPSDPDGADPISLGLPAHPFAATQGEERKVPLTVERSEGFSGSVTLSLVAAPQGVTASFDPATLGADEGEATMHLTIGASVVPGTHRIEVRASAQGGVTGSAAMSAELHELGTPFARLDVGRSHACALTEGGEAFCWGVGANGRLGVGATEDRDVPTAVAGGLTFGRISVGGIHTCGVTTGGEAYCWGAGGLLGIASGHPSDVPVPVSGGIEFTEISAGDAHSCGVSSDGSAYCWGWGAGGRLGNGSTADHLTPTEAAGGIRFASVEAGDIFSCGISVGGDTYCWGEGTAGQLGDDNMTSDPWPVAVVGGHVFASLDLEASLACGLTVAGDAYCWGDGSVHGRLGDGNRFAASVPNPVAHVGALSGVSVGKSHVCAVAALGDGLCWGHGHWGKLGRHPDSDDDALTPVPIWGGHAFESVGAGEFHSCGLTTAGSVYCWGWNSGGRLGSGSGGAAEETVPVLVTSPTG